MEGKLDGYSKYYNQHLELFTEKVTCSNLEILQKKLIPATACKLYKLDFLRSNNITFIDDRALHEDEGWFLKCLSRDPQYAATTKNIYKRRLHSSSIMGKSFYGSKKDKIKSQEGREKSAQDAELYMSYYNDYFFFVYKEGILSKKSKRHLYRKFLKHKLLYVRSGKKNTYHRIYYRLAKDLL